MRHKLDNGLNIILEENHSARVVACQAWIGVGSGDEYQEESGLAHIHEHMLFKGTLSRGVGEIARDVEGAGGDINASTSHDNTVYYIVIPSSELRIGLDILADALQNSTFDEEELRKEQEVVLEEIKRTEDLPGGRLSRRLFNLAYVNHPYRRPVLGTSETVKSFSRNDILNFFSKHYRPDNTTLVLSGDFDEKSVLEDIKKLFGGWKNVINRAESPRISEKSKDIEDLSLEIISENVHECHLALAWPIPGINHPDIASLDVLSVILGHSESCRLITELRRRRQIVNSAGAYVYSPKDPGLLIIGCQAPPSNGIESLKGLLRETLRFRHERVTKEELKKAITIIESDILYQSQTVQGRARWLGFFESMAGGIEKEKEFYDRIRSVTGDDILRVANRYLSVSKLALEAIVPPGENLDESVAVKICREAGENIAAQNIPEIAVRKDSHSKEKEKEKKLINKKNLRNKTGEVYFGTLSSGAKIIFQPDSSVGLVSMRTVEIGGQRFETPLNAGISNLASNLLTGGTLFHSAEDIALLSDEWAGSLQGVSGRNSFGIECEVLSRNFEPAFRLMAECLLSPAFPEKEFQKEKHLVLEDIRAKDDYPAERSFELFRETLWLKHPYRMDTRGTIESLSGMDTESIRNYLEKNHHPSGLCLSIAGTADHSTVLSLSEELFGKLNPPPPEFSPEAPFTEEPSADGPRMAFRELKKEQAHIVLGFPGVSLTNPDRFSMEVISTILSGQGGRLFVELRDRKSLAYSVASFNLEGIDPGFFCVYIACSPEKAQEAINSIRDELSRLRESKVSGEELARTKRYLSGSHEIGLQRPSARAAVMAFDETYGLGYLAHRNYSRNIESVTEEKILNVSQRYLDPSEEVLAVVAPYYKD